LQRLAKDITWRIKDEMAGSYKSQRATDGSVRTARKLEGQVAAAARIAQQLPRAKVPERINIKKINESD